MNTILDSYYYLFTQLRDGGFPLGTQDYLLFIEAIKTEIYPLEIDKLKQLCRTLWVKSRSQHQQFEAIFNHIILPPIPEEIDSNQPILIKKDTPKSISTQTITPKNNIEKPPNLPPKPQDNNEYFLFPASPLTDSTTLEEDSEVVKAMKVSPQHNWMNFKPPQNPREYFPVTPEQMTQGWYQLKTSLQTGTRLEFNIQATIEQIQRQGKPITPVFKPCRQKNSNLMLFIAQRGSMQPFQILSRKLVETAQQTGCLDPNRCYYFHQHLSDNFFRDSDFEEEIPLDAILELTQPQKTVILIFSNGDAGEKRYSSYHFNATKNVLNRLQSSVKAIAWLNPFPQPDWRYTTADHIATLKTVKMFPIDRQGFYNALQILQ
ncbi:putative VWA containing CoxE family protein [Planktothrix serta PCC 8927]|uniref:VWA containing CoxE family protein n=1 Tax=Planktothrix serta PCC 8927 TaxID=671068 RepID=A0A7Z9BF02_9CYAN|nr:hypothetical protein [Planktothrix serta]VXD11281.1 putative VWA containing CoxE family protein [Planktothrix serta PCC 8927]